jgi:hypothetical protein
LCLNVRDTKLALRLYKRAGFRLVPPALDLSWGGVGANFDPAGKSEDGPADLGRLLGSRRNGSVVELNHATWSAFLSLTAY